jgi:hypothetical protein
MIVKICTKEDLNDIHNLLYSHEKIAGLLIEKPTLEEFKKKFSDDVITFGYYVNNELISFLITRKLSELPSWYVSMISSKNLNFFKFNNSGLADLFDAAVEYWESKNLYSFIFVQSVKHRNLLNGKITKSSNNLKKYQIPGATLEVIKKNSKSKSTLINKLCKNYTYPNDIIIKWVFRKDYLQENFKK